MDNLQKFLLPYIKSVTEVYDDYTRKRQRIFQQAIQDSDAGILDFAIMCLGTKVYVAILFTEGRSDHFWLDRKELEED